MAKLKKERTETNYILFSQEEHKEAGEAIGKVLSTIRAEGKNTLFFDGCTKDYTPENIVEDIIKKQQIQKIDNIVITNKAMNTDFIKNVMEELSKVLRRKQNAQRVQQRTR